MLGYIDLGGLYAPPIGRLNIFISSMLGYIDLGASCPIGRGIKYFYK
jgi:hypothetical protein